MKHTDDKLQFRLQALVTNANYSVKKAVMLLFINREFSVRVLPLVLLLPTTTDANQGTTCGLIVTFLEQLH